MNKQNITTISVAFLLCFLSYTVKAEGNILPIYKQFRISKTQSGTTNKIPLDGAVIRPFTVLDGKLRDCCITTTRGDIKWCNGKGPEGGIDLPSGSGFAWAVYDATTGNSDVWFTQTEQIDPSWSLIDGMFYTRVCSFSDGKLISKYKGNKTLIVYKDKSYQQQTLQDVGVKEADFMCCLYFGMDSFEIEGSKVDYNHIISWIQDKSTGIRNYNIYQNPRVMAGITARKDNFESELKFRLTRSKNLTCFVSAHGSKAYPGGIGLIGGEVTPINFWETVNSHANDNSNVFLLLESCYAGWFAEKEYFQSHARGIKKGCTAANLKSQYGLHSSDYGGWYYNRLTQYTTGIPTYAQLKDVYETIEIRKRYNSYYWLPTKQMVKDYVKHNVRNGSDETELLDQGMMINEFYRDVLKDPYSWDGTVGFMIYMVPIDVFSLGFPTNDYILRFGEK